MASPPGPDALAGALAGCYGPDLEILGLRRLSGGASRETWSFDAVEPDGTTHGLVLRRDPAVSHTGPTDRSTEYDLLGAAARGGVPVPRVVRLLTDADGLGAGFVMARVEGETIARKILRDDEYAPARPLLATQCGTIAAAIHALGSSDLPPLATLGPGAQIRQYRDTLDLFGEAHPAFELALQWLDHHAPPEPLEPRLVHGDFRLGNFIVGPDGIRAVLDWELTHLGDPAEDLGWLCVKSWRFGVADRIVGGFGDVPTLLDAYEAAGGNRVGADELRFWIVLGTLKWGVICISQAFTHLHGVVRSVELATLGRRVAEMEWDVLALLDGGW